MAKKEDAPSETKDISSIIARCQVDHPKEKEIQLLKHELNTDPGLLKTMGNLTNINVQQMAAQIHNAALTTAIDCYVPALKKELGYRDAPMLEKLAIDGVVLAWLRYQTVEIYYTKNTRGVSLHQAAYYEKSLTAAQGRYLKALESLAKIRKLARRDPALQLNIAAAGGQQVNVGGDLVKGKQEHALVNDLGV